VEAGKSADRDWGQKLRVRHALRAAGAGTRMNVLLASVSDDHATIVPSSYTDVDVLGLSFTADFRAIYTLAYCTTSKIGTDRVLWLRGLRDEFPGATALLVAREIPKSARELSTRSGILCFDDGELDLYVAQQERRVEVSKRRLEERLEPGVAAFDRAIAALPTPFGSVLAFRDYLFLEFGPARNLQLAIGYLRTPAAAWQPTNRTHLALLLDVAALYVAALVACGRHVLGRSLSRISDGVEEFLGGGAVGLREKRHFAELLVELISALERDGSHVPAGLRESMQPLPAYSRELAALVESVLDAPEIVETLPFIMETLRLAATLKFQDVAGELIDAGWPERTVERSLRLTRDVVAFLAANAGLDRRFLTIFDELLAPPLLRDELHAKPSPPRDSEPAATRPDHQIAR
jgi:hypothetical protein